MGYRVASLDWVGDARAYEASLSMTLNTNKQFCDSLRAKAMEMFAGESKFSAVVKATVTSVRITANDQGAVLSATFCIGNGDLIHRARQIGKDEFREIILDLI